MSGMVYDRTEADVRAALAARQRLQNGAPEQGDVNLLERGMLSTATINRIESKAAEIYDALEAMGIMVSRRVTKSWVDGDYFTASDFSRLRSIALVLLVAYPWLVKTDTPSSVDNKITIGYANNIEHILSDIDDMIRNTQAAYVYSGELFGGEIV